MKYNAYKSRTYPRPEGQKKKNVVEGSEKSVFNIISLES